MARVVAVSDSPFDETQTNRRRRGGGLGVRAAVAAPRLRN
jgi:hypothetical protein